MSTDDTRKYPLPATDEDARFTFGLVLDVRDVLTAHGYPQITAGSDFVDLQQTLFRFLYTESDRPKRTNPVENPSIIGEEC